MTGKSHRSDRSGVVIWGLIMIAIGCWLLLRTLGLRLPGIGQMWPIFPMIVGLSMFVGWLLAPNKRNNHGIMIPATINTLVGMFFFAFTLRFVPWHAMAILWPVFPLIVGIAFFVAWVFSLFSNWGLLIPAGITSMVGIVGLSYTVGGQSDLFGWIVSYAPLALIALGVLILISSLFSFSGYRSRRSGGSSGAPATTGLESYEPAGDETTSQEFKRQDE